MKMKMLSHENFVVKNLDKRWELKAYQSKVFTLTFYVARRLQVNLIIEQFIFIICLPFSSPRNKTIKAKDESGERNFSLLKLDVKMMKRRSQEATENSQREKAIFHFNEFSLCGGKVAIRSKF